jgi:hypothetical protein
MRSLVFAAALLIPVSLPITARADVLAERPGESSVAAARQSGWSLGAAFPGATSGACSQKADAAVFMLAKGGAAGYGGSSSSSGAKGSGSSKSGAAGYRSSGEAGYQSGAGSNTGNLLNRSTPNEPRSPKSSPPGPTETPPGVGEGHGD